MNIKSSILEVIGNTPLVDITSFTNTFGAKSRIVAKIESCNPSGSIKDRASYYMLKIALDHNLINSETKIIEPTSGNTGIGLAMACASLGLKLILTLPETMSMERRAILKAYGASLVLTDGALGMKGAIDKANELKALDQNSFVPSQFDNLSNVKAHIETTGPEIFNDTDGLVDIVVAGVGTGGTITGIGKYLKSKKDTVKMIAVEPETSAVLSGQKAGPHKIQGIGAGFIPYILDTSIIDEIVRIGNDEAMDMGSMLAKKAGIFAGISSGAALLAAIKIGKREENKDKLIVVILPDSGDRYLSTPMFAQD